jgi:hypothetical protein
MELGARKVHSALWAGHSSLRMSSICILHVLDLVQLKECWSTRVSLLAQNGGRALFLSNALILCFRDGIFALSILIYLFA